MNNKKKYAIGKNPNSHKPTKEANAKRSESLKQKHKEKEWGFIEGFVPWNKGKSHLPGIPRHNYDDSFKEKISKEMRERVENGWKPWNKNLTKKDSKMLSKLSQSMMGENNPAWKNGITEYNYPVEFSRGLRRKIRSRDNYICQECRHSEDDLGYSLSVHHIDYDKNNNQESNLISLCKSCHAKTNWNRESWEEYYKEKIGGNRNGRIS